MRSAYDPQQTSTHILGFLSLAATAAVKTTWCCQSSQNWSEATMLEHYLEPDARVLGAIRLLLPPLLPIDAADCANILSGASRDIPRS